MVSKGVKVRNIKRLFISKCEDCTYREWCKVSVPCGGIPDECTLMNATESNLKRQEYGIRVPRTQIIEDMYGYLYGKGDPYKQSPENVKCPHCGWRMKYNIFKTEYNGETYFYSKCTCAQAACPNYVPDITDGEIHEVVFIPKVRNDNSQDKV